MWRKSREPAESPETEDGEGEVGGDVSEVWDAEPSALVGELVVAEGLGCARGKRGDNNYHCREDCQSQRCFPARHAMQYMEVAPSACSSLQ